MSNNFTCNTRCSRGHLYNKKQTKFRKTITTMVQSSANLKLKMLPVIAVLNTTYNDTCLTAVSREEEFSIIILIIHAFCLNVYNVLQVLKVACRKYCKLQFKLMLKSLFFFHTIRLKMLSSFKSFFTKQQTCISGMPNSGMNDS